MQNHAFQRIAVVFPCLAFERAKGIGVTCLPAAANPRRAEVDVLGVVLVVEPRRVRACLGERRNLLGKDSLKLGDGVPFLRAKFLREHSLTIFLVITGIGWVLAFWAMDSESKWGQVVGNIVSEWTQILGLVLMTKRLIEVGSKEH